MRLCFSFLCVLVAAASLVQGDAILPPAQKSLPNLDRRAPVPEAILARHDEAAEALARLRTKAHAVHLELHPILGSPKFVWSPSGFLTPPVAGLPQPEAKGSKAVAKALAQTEASSLVGQFIDAHRGLFGHGADVWADAVIRRHFVTADTGLRTIVWGQQVEQIEVFDAVLIAHVTRNGELVNLASQFVPTPGVAAKVDVATFAGEAPGEPRLTSAAAIALAARDLGVELAAEALEARAEPDGPDRRQRWIGGALKGEARTRLVWLPVTRDHLRLAWEVELSVRGRPELYRILVDAQDGVVWIRRCLTHAIRDATYRVFTADSPSPFSPGHAVPATNQPPIVERELITLPALSVAASPAGWINDEDNETRGNNVDAHTDLDDDDQPELPRPAGQPFRVFDFPLNFTQAPTNHSAASVVQLFYWCNWMHDRLYELGFTEAAGNFQVDNFGRGGQAGDPVLADAQDGGGFNNANFTTPADGNPGRIQMFLWDGPKPARDGDLDAEVILHEYAHGLSNRRVGGGIGISALQSLGLGEGWSDFYALALLSESSDDPEANYAPAAYLAFRLFGLQENYYFGIRRYPYSVRIDKNPLTLKDIDPGQAGAHPGIPANPVFSSSPADEIHNQGEVWCAALWELRFQLISKLGVQAGNLLALQLVTDGLNLSPPDPTFLQARDAILQAELVRTGGAHREELWTAFARRGLGFGATGPPSNTTTGVEEAFDLPDDLTVQPSAGLVASGEIGGPFEPPGTTYTLANVGTNDVAWSALQNATWYDLSTDAGMLPAGAATVPLTVTINSAASTLPQGIYNDLLTFTNHLTHRTQSRRIRLRVGQPDPFSEQFDKDNDLAGHVHLFTPDSSASRYRVCRETAFAFPTDPAGGTVLNLEDDGFEEVTLTDGKQVVLYERSYGRVFVSANGFVTFLAGTGEFAETLAGHFATPRVSALFDDLNPEEGGTVSWRQLDDRLAVTWQDVPQFRASDRNSFQVELFFDGRIRMTHLDVGARDGLVGLSSGGGIADGFMESDFASYGPCVEPLALELPSSTTEGAGLIQGLVVLAEARSTNVLVTLTSSDPDEITAPGSVLIPAGNTRATFALSVGDDHRLDGSRLVRITASAEGFGTRSASVSVHDNERAFLDLVLPARATEGDGFLPNAGRINVDPAPDTDVAVNLVSGDPTELELPSVVIVPARSPGVNFDLTIRDDDWIDGSRSISARASVQNWGAAEALMQVDDNESLNLTVVLPARVSEGNPVLRGAGSVRLSGRLPTNLVVRIASSDITELRVAQTMVAAGATSAAFDLTVMDDPEVDGAQDVVVTASADGFNPGTATVRVYDNESPPAPSNPTPPDLATNVAPFTDLAWSPGEGDIIVNGRFETGDLTGWRLESTGDGGYVINDGTFDPPGNEGPLPPFAGRFSALSQQTGSGRRALVQQVTIPPGATTAVLSWAHRVRNQASQFLDPDHEYRVEVRGPGATTLEVLFSTNPGDPLGQDWTEHSADLSRYIGQTVEIVFVENDLPGFLNVHLDNVSLTLGSASAPTAFDVYLGPTTVLGEAHRQGETSAPAWDLPRLDLDQTYYWQVVARRGAAQTPGPVWQFRVPGVGPVDHFAWSPIPSPQVAGRAFSATLTALDVFENVVASFEGTASLSGRTVLPDLTLGTGTNRWNFPLGAFDQDSRLQLILRTNEIGAARRITALTLEVDAAPPGTLQRFTVRMKHTSLGAYGLSPVWESAGWTTVLQRDLAVEKPGLLVLPLATPFEFNGTNHLMIDLSFNNSVYSADGFCLAWSAAERRSISFRSDSLHGDPLQWSGISPQPQPSHWVPNLRLASEAAVAVDPAVTSAFSHGTWQGLLVVNTVGPDLRLRAEDSRGHFAWSQPFAVNLENDASVTLGASPEPVLAGDPLTYTVTAINVGPALADGIALTNTLPDGVTFVSANSSTGSVRRQDGTIVAEIGQLAGGASATVTIVVTPFTQGTLTNRVRLARLGTDPDPANNAAEVVTHVITPLLSVGDATVSEGPSGTVNATFPVFLSFPATRPVTVRYATIEGTATAGADFTATTGTLVLAPGLTNATVIVPIHGDLLNEPNETFVLRLTEPVHAALAVAEGRGTIVDDDPAPCLEIADVVAIEPLTGTATALVAVTLSQPSGRTVQVSYHTANGPATAGSDYEQTAGTLEFPPGVTRREIPILIHSDAISEGDEMFQIALSAPVHATVCDAQGTVTIRDRESVEPGRLHHFTWAPLPATLGVNVPFPVTVTARDALEAVVPGFSGRVNLTARSEAPEVIIGSGEAIWSFPLAASFHDARLQCLYLAAEIGPARPLTALALKVAAPPGQALGQWTIRLKHTGLSRYVNPAWETDDWQTVFQRTEAITGTGWVTFQFGTPFPYNGVDNLLIDFSFNNSSNSADGLCTFSTVEAPRALFYRTDSSFGDPLGWSGPASPTPNVAAQVPNLRFSSRSPVALSLETSPNFLNGAWSGQLAVLEPSLEVVLRADDGAGHLGLTPPLQIILTNDIGLTVFPSAPASVVGSELTYAIIVTNTGAGAATDVVVRDVIPAGLTFLGIQAPNAITDFAQGVVSARFARLEAAASAALNLTVRLESVGTVTNQVTVTRAEPDGYADNNSVRAITRVTAPPLLSIEDVFTAEGDAGGPTVAFHLALSSASPLPSSVEFATFDGGARAGSDYTATNGVLVIPPGATSALLVVPILADTRYETNESFLVRLSQPINLTLARTEAQAVLVNDDPAPSLRVADFVQREGNTGLGEAPFRITLEPAVEVPVAVRYATANGTAKVNTDFLATTGLVTFDAGVTTQLVAVTIKGDVAIEPDETLHLDLSAPTNAVLVSARGTLTLLNDDGLPGELHRFEWAPIASAQVVGQPFPVEIIARDATGAIAPTFQGFAQLAARAGEPEVTVGDGASSWSLPFDSALHDVRLQVIYPATELGRARRLTGLALDVTQLPGQVLRRFNIRLRTTALAEYPTSGAVWEDDWTTVYTRDQQIASTGWTEFTFDRPFDYDGGSNLMVDFSFNNDSATSSGQVRATTTTAFRSIYQRSDSLLGNPLTWSGPTTPVPVTASQIPNVRLFTRTLIALTPAEAGPFVEGRWNGTVTLLDPGAPIQITATDGDGHEGASDLLTAILVNDLAVAVTHTPDPILPRQALVYSITITNTGPSEATGVVLTNLIPANAVVLSVHTSQGTADTSAAPRITGAMGTIAAGATAIVTITVAAESPGWLTNTVLVARQEADAYLANNSALTVTRITQPPLLAIADAQVVEGTVGTTNLSFAVTLSFPVSVPVTVHYGTVPGSATAGSDFTAAENVLTFEPGLTHRNIDISIVADNANEIPETFTLELFGPTVAQLGDASAVGLILDDDPLPALVIADVRVVEGDTGTVFALLQVTLSPPSGQLVTATFATASDAASEGTDYIATSGSVSFPPGQTTQLIAVPVLGDVSVEPDERFFVDLTNPVNTTLGRSRATAVILNDDGLPGQVDHFTWSPLPGDRYEGIPWIVTLEARDYFGALVTNFTGAARLSLPLAGVDVTIGAGTASWDYPLNTIWEDTRVQSIYLASELEGPRRITALAIYVTVPPGQALENWTLRLKHTTRASYGTAPSWEPAGWTVCYRASPTIIQTGWHTFAFTTPFDYDGTSHLMADFSYNNSTFTTSGQVRFSTTATRRSIFSSTDSWEGDPIDWSGPDNPPPNYANRMVNIRLTSSRSIPISPSLATPFVHGTWIGAVTVAQPGTNLVLRADDGAGHVSLSAPFNVAPFVDGDADGLPADWELAHRLDPADPSDAAEDLDEDGLSNLEEFRAGTDPTSAPSALRILSVAVENGHATIRFASATGKGYRVERSDAAAGSDWIDLSGLLAGDGSVLEVRDAVPADARARFYRIRLLP